MRAADPGTRRAEPMRAHRTAAERPRRARVGRRRVVLVACADRDARTICETWLRHVGCDVHVAGDGDAAVALHDAVRPDLVVTTYPNRTSGGEPLASRLRRLAGPRRVPVLSLASRVRAEELAEAAAAGVDESLAMPVCLGDLLDAVERLAGPGARG